MPFITSINMSELLAEPQFKAREFFVGIEHPATGKVTYPSAPFKMSATPWQAGHAPLLAEHNKEIYCQRLGYTKDDLVRLRETGVI
jgi:crotonobetainyl-CoA:carnitine CoA-transferase CaiB-like acyl-CoA transferase